MINKQEAYKNAIKINPPPVIFKTTLDVILKTIEIESKNGYYQCNITLWEGDDFGGVKGSIKSDSLKLKTIIEHLNNLGFKTEFKENLSILKIFWN